ncbi:unnamed protein product [Effrenium voratum]|nr:unnamed protein product [Effrenium voratum]
MAVALGRVMNLEQAEAGEAPLPVVQGIPVRAGPGVRDTRGGSAAGRENRSSQRYLPSTALPHPSAPPRVILDADQQAVLNYRMAVICFALVDIFSTLLNATAVYAAGFQKSWWHLAALGVLLGPLSGLLGAKLMNRCLVGIYFAFCCVKAVLLIAMCAMSLFLWALLFTFLQFWITKVVGTFLWVLGNLAPDQRKNILEAKDYEVQAVYW